MFLQQLKFNFVVFFLMILDILWCFGKWRLIDLKYISPISIFTIFESGAKLLNQIILNCLFLVFYFDLFPLSLTFNWSNIKNTNYYICKLSRYNLLMVSSKPICFQFCFPNFQITERLFHPRVLLKLNLENPTIQE